MRARVSDALEHQPDASRGSMVRLFLRVGRRDGVRPADLVGAIANEAGLSGDQIGDIDLYDTFSFVEVPEESGDQGHHRAQRYHYTRT